MTNTVNQRSANNINKLKTFVKDNQFDEEHEDDDSFFFNLKKDDQNEVIFGDGSNLDHLNLMVSSKKFRYSGVKNVHDIRTDDKRCYKLCSCNCSGFVKWALCPHIVA